MGLEGMLRGIGNFRLEVDENFFYRWQLTYIKTYVMVKLFNHFLIAFKLSHLYTEISVFCIYPFLVVFVCAV